ncbi:hypothetical protein V492_06235, partial [Pseudogymnoascus sp. VKM F-4246]
MLILLHKPPIILIPERIRRQRDQHAHQETKECQSDLREREVVVIAEDERKRAEEEVEDAEQEAGEDAEIQDHEFQREQLEGPVERDANLVRDSLSAQLHGGFVAVVACLGADLARLVAEEHGVEGGAGEAVEEAGDEEGGHVLGDGGGDDPDDEESERYQVDGTPAIELGERREKHRTAAQAEDEQGQPNRGYNPTGVEFRQDLLIGGRVYRRHTSSTDHQHSFLTQAVPGKGTTYTDPAATELISTIVHFCQFFLLLGLNGSAS